MPGPLNATDSRSTFYGTVSFLFLISDSNLIFNSISKIDTILIFQFLIFFLQQLLHIIALVSVKDSIYY